MHIIAINGLPESGKDTIADHLVRQHGYVRLAFADELKAELAEVFVTSRATFDYRPTKAIAQPQLALIHCADEEFVRFVLNQPDVLQTQQGRFAAMVEPRSPRWLMRTYGTDYRKRTDPTYWIRPVLAGISIARNKGKNVVISDLRFADEGAALEGLDVPTTVIEVIRNNGITRSGHDSDAEYPQDKIDVRLHNIGPISALLRLADGVVKFVEK